MYTPYTPRKRSDPTDKRKRAERGSTEKEEEDIFKKGKLIGGSPLKKTGEKNEEKMEEVKILLGKLAISIDQMNDQMKTNHEDLKNEIQNNTLAIDGIKREYENKEKVWQEEKEGMKKEINDLKKRLEEQDKKGRMNNIVIKGLKTKGRIPKEVVNELLKNELKVDCKVKTVTEVKIRNTETQEPEPMIIAELEDCEKKKIVMENKNKLKGRKIFINNDWTQQERKMKFAIRQKLKEVRGTNKTVKVFYSKVAVDNNMFVWNEEKEILEVQPKEEERKETGLQATA